MMNNMNISRMRNKGFTLIELMMVLTIMAVVSTVLLKSMSGLQDQSRYDQTVERVNQIKKAIVNTQTINGVTVVTGFVADMGRLPNNLRELVDNSLASNPLWANGICSASTYTTQISCTTNGASWTPYNANLNVGWNGPYIQISNDPSKPDAFTDGWGKTSTDNNYGWTYSNNTQNYITLQSKGSDGSTANTNLVSDPFEAEYPVNPATVIQTLDWQFLSNTPITINLHKDSTLCTFNIINPASVLNPITAPFTETITISNTQPLTITGTPNSPVLNTCPTSQTICLNVFFRDPNTNSILIATGTSLNNTNDGQPTTLQFTLNSVIPAGQNAISISAPIPPSTTCDASTINNTYPAGHPPQPIPQMFIPKIPLVFNW
jgi:prepilin-type N-terminal cleavage/methylation domain-containing protein